MNNETIRHRQLPQVEALESRLPLSGVAGTSHDALASRAASAIVQRQGPVVTLQGSARGVFVTTHGNPDTGATYQITTSGRLSPLGQTAESARVQTTGFVLTGSATGTMTVTGAHGSLKLNLQGTLQSGSSTLPRTLTYTIISGSRSFRNAEGSGVIDVTINASFASQRVGQITLNFHA
jgi:hypothetical protein